MVWAIGGLPKCPKLTCSGHTFGGCWFLLILILVSTHCIMPVILLKMSPYEELVALHCCFYLHSHASSGTLLHILRIYAIFVYFALVPSHALGA